MIIQPRRVSTLLVVAVVITIITITIVAINYPVKSQQLAAASSDVLYVEAFPGAFLQAFPCTYKSSPDCSSKRS